jgi:ankyrin repeat protein
VKNYRDKGLLLSVQKRHVSVVDLLLKHGNVNAAMHNNAAIIQASANGDFNIVKLLLERPEVDPSASNNKALIVATRNGNTEIVRLLLEQPTVKSAERYYLAAFIASGLDHTDIVKLFIGNGNVNPRDVKIYALDKATRLGNVELVRYMLGFPMYSQEAHLIFFTDNLFSIKTVFEAGYKYDKDTLENALHYAISKGNYDIVEYLESKIDIPKLPERPLIAMSEQCAICLSNENLLEGYKTACQHQFHVGCLQSWIANHNTCPMCRSSIL